MPLQVIGNVVYPKADVYRNLHKRIWSVRDRTTGLVVKHSQLVYVSDAKFIVQPAGRARVLRERRKNVHAFVRGTVVDFGFPPDWRALLPMKITYNPYKADHFFAVEDKEKTSIIEAPLVILDEDGVWIPVTWAMNI